MENSSPSAVSRAAYMASSLLSVLRPTPPTPTPAPTPSSHTPSAPMASLEDVAVLCRELEGERSAVQEEAESIAALRLETVARLREVERDMAILMERKGRLEQTLLDIAGAEERVREEGSVLDRKLASIGSVSAGFADTVRTIKAEPDSTLGEGGGGGGGGPSETGRRKEGSMRDLVTGILLQPYASGWGRGANEDAGVTMGGGAMMGGGEEDERRVGSPVGGGGGYFTPYVRASSTSPTKGVSVLDAETGAFHVRSPSPRGGGGGGGGGGMRGVVDTCNRTFHGHTAGVAAVVYEPLSGRVVSGSGDGTVRLWDASSGACERVLVGHTGWVRTLDANGELVISGSGDKSIRVWDVATGDAAAVLTGHSGSVSALQFEGSTLVSGSVDQSARVWDLESGSVVLSMREHSSYVSSLQFWNYGCATGSGDKTVKMWDIRTGQCHRTLEGHEGAVLALQFDANTLYTGSTDRTLRAWDLRMGGIVTTVDMPGAVQALSFAGTHLVAAAEQPVVHVFDTAGLVEAGELSGHSSVVKSLHLSLGGWVVSGGADCCVKSWQL